MFQATSTSTDTAPSTHLFRALWSTHDRAGEVISKTQDISPLAVKDVAATVEMLQASAEQLRKRVARQDPLLTLAQAEEMIAAPLGQLLHDASDRISPSANDMLRQAASWLGCIDSIGDTLDPQADRGDCIACATESLRIAADALSFAQWDLR